VIDVATITLELAQPDGEPDTSKALAGVSGDGLPTETVGVGAGDTVGVGGIVVVTTEDAKELIANELDMDDELRPEVSNVLARLLLSDCENPK